MLILLLTVSIVVAALWQRVQSLTARIDALEAGGAVAGPAVADPQAVTSEGVSPWSLPPSSLARADAPWPAPIDEHHIPDPAPATATPVLDEPAPHRRAGFEEVFGRRLPIWAGGATLAVAGFLVVRWSIEAGLLSPAVRVALGLLFGAALIGAAEAALRREAVVGDVRVRQALAGAGVATLYGCILAAANLYALIGPATAFAALAAATVLAGALSLRFGSPSAVLGLVGGLAAPALIGATQPDVPLLTLYLGFAIGGLAALGRQQRWWWLGASALVGGFGWGALLILDHALSKADTVALGVFTVALAVLVPLLIVGRRSGAVRLAGGLVGCAQLAVLVASGGFAPLHWALYGLLSAAVMWLSRRDASLADAPILALGIGVLLTLAWPAPSTVALALVLGGAAIVFGMPTALRVWRGDARATDAPMLAMLALAIGLVPLIHDDTTAIPALIGAAGTALVAARGWRVEGRRDDARFATLVLTAAALAMVAGSWTLPGWSWAPVAALVALALHLVGQAGGDVRVVRGSGVFVAGAVALLVEDRSVVRLFGLPHKGSTPAWASWGVPAAVTAAIAVDRRTPVMAARVAQALAALLGYAAAAQIVPAFWLPLVPAAMIAGVATTRRAEAWPALAVSIGLSLGWAALPFQTWASVTMVATAWAFVPSTDWPSLADAALRLALPAAAMGLAALTIPLDRRVRATLLAIAGAGGVIAAEVLVKHLFAIDTPARFVARAVPERFCWELLLAMLAAAAWRRGGRRAAIALGAGSLLHLTWFTLLFANPLIVVQEPGAWLALSYATAGALLWAMPRVLPEARVARDRMAMALIVVAGFTLLRQAAHAPMVLAAGTGAGEQIARSLLALAMAGGFLWIGIRRSLREWRLASLALMLVAVAKVFLSDAAGLDGLARIGSFAALGFSLIGIGWLYARYLPAQDRS